MFHDIYESVFFDCFVSSKTYNVKNTIPIAPMGDKGKCREKSLT